MPSAHMISACARESTSGDFTVQRVRPVPAVRDCQRCHQSCRAAYGALHHQHHALESTIAAATVGSVKISPQKISTKMCEWLKPRNTLKTANPRHMRTPPQLPQPAVPILSLQHYQPRCTNDWNPEIPLKLQIQDRKNNTHDVLYFVLKSQIQELQHNFVSLKCHGCQ